MDGNRREEQSAFDRGQEDARIAIEYIAGAVCTLAEFFGAYLEGPAQSGYSADLGEELPEEEPDKTQIADCRGCWCNTCANIEKCVIPNVRDAKPDGIRPVPCIGCLDGMRGMPKEEEPFCGEYVEYEGFNYG